MIFKLIFLHFSSGVQFGFFFLPPSCIILFGFIVYPVHERNHKKLRDTKLVSRLREYVGPDHT